MSYNPNRKNKSNQKRARRIAPPKGSGIKHADIVRSRGIGRVAPLGSKKIETLHGFTSSVFECDDFIQYYECIYAGNNQGFGVNPKANKTFRVMTGSVFLTIGHLEDGKITDKDVKIVYEGRYVNLKAGLPYSLATSGDLDVELLVTETKDYNDTWEILEVGISDVTREILLVDPSGSETITKDVRRSNENARKVAAERAQRRDEARSIPKENREPNNPNSSAVVGVNPKPTLPPLDD